MAETKTNTRGRKPKVVENIDIQNSNVADMMDMVSQMQQQILELQKQLEKSNKEVEKTDKENLELSKLVEILKSNKTESSSLPTKVKVISLLPNKYNLTTQDGGHGKAFTFEKFGDMITMKTSELEEILSVQKQREQAEKGYFYILDKDIIEYQDLSEEYKNINNKETLEKVMNLEIEECVDIFCGLGKEMQESLATIMAEKLNNGERLDRNKLADISMRTDIDIEKIAQNLNKNKK